MPDQFDVAANAALHVINDKPESLTMSISKQLNDPDMTNGAFIATTQAIDDLDDVLDGMHKPFEERKNVGDWLQHYGLPSDATSQNVAEKIGRRLQQEYVGNEVAQRLAQRDKVNHPTKQSLPPIKTEKKPAVSLRDDVVSAVKLARLR